MIRMILIKTKEKRRKNPPPKHINTHACLFRVSLQVSFPSIYEDEEFMILGTVYVFKLEFRHSPIHWKSGVRP